MSASDPQAIQARYEAAFGNIDEIAMPQLLVDPRFNSLLQAAIDRGRAVTGAELRGAFPDEDWETVQA